MVYDFHYDDEDTVMNEIDEFYSYVEMPQVAENLKAWENSYTTGMKLPNNLEILSVLNQCRMDEEHARTAESSR